MKLRDLDLNLLVTLHALLEERNVTRAARRLHLSQPAASNALARLRTLFGDALLVRTPNGMARTPKAELLVHRIGLALADLEQAVCAPTDFEPAQSEATFTIAMSDYTETVLLPHLLARLASEAPRVVLTVQPPTDRDLQALEQGQLDVMFAPPMSQGGPTLFRQLLFDDRLVCIARQKHPVVRGALSLEQFLSVPQILVALQAGSRSAIDEQLAERGLSRHVTLRVPHFVVVPRIVAHSDLLATLAERVALDMAAPLGLQLLPHPLSPPRFSIVQMWHERTHNSPAHQWLRALIARISHELPGQNSDA